MDIRAKIILDTIKSVKGASNACIAGGAVRDMRINQYYGTRLEAKDVDILVPIDAIWDVDDALRKAKINPESKSADKYYSTSSKRYRSKHHIFGFDYEGVSFDLISHAFKDDEDFPQKAIDTFDYGICMCYYDGLSIIEDERFTTDMTSSKMTLYNLNSLQDLPRSIERFNRLNEKFRKSGLSDFLFSVDPNLLTFKPKKVEEVEKLEATYRLGTKNLLWANAPAQPAAVEARWERELRLDRVADVEPAQERDEVPGIVDFIADFNN